MGGAFVRGLGDCHVAALLAMTGGAFCLLCDRRRALGGKRADSYCSGIFVDFASDNWYGGGVQWMDGGGLVRRPEFKEVHAEDYYLNRQECFLLRRFC